MCDGSSGGVRKRCTTFKDVLLINDSSPMSHQKQGNAEGGTFLCNLCNFEQFRKSLHGNIVDPTYNDVGRKEGLFLTLPNIEF
jgi:hypothetical protein